MEKEVRNGLWDSYRNFRISAKTDWIKYRESRRELVKAIYNSKDKRLISACSLSENSLISYNLNDRNFSEFLGMIKFKINWTEEDEKEVAEDLKMKRER